MGNAVGIRPSPSIGPRGAFGSRNIRWFRIGAGGIACALGATATFPGMAAPAAPSARSSPSPAVTQQEATPGSGKAVTADFLADVSARKHHRILLALQEEAPPVHDAGSGAKADALADIATRKSYWIPAAEIVGFDVILNLINRRVYGDDYKSDMTSIRRNLQSGWRVDSDPFTTNQLGHPYQGSMYHGFARSAGLNYWESLGYTFVGSAAWEIAGETTPPSLNDQITTGFGGSFLGEALFRMSNLVLEKSEMPTFWRELSAAVISPATGFNRLAFGDRFDTVYPSGDAVYYGRMAIGASTVLKNKSSVSIDDLQHTEVLADVSLDYGLPGEPGYQYKRPFDHFVFKATISSANGFENLMTRGLLVGTDYEAGPNYRGVWGLYGSYDYMEPQVFRISSTALSLGTTAQMWLSRTIALQGSALAGAGYAAVGTVNATAENDHHYGVAPQALLALRLIFGDRASIDTTTRGYFVSNVGGVNQAGATDNIYRTDAALTVRVHGRHAVSLRYLYSRRDSSSTAQGDMSQSSGTIGVFYTLLGADELGVVDWRNRD
jgi:hypothetical protein